MSITLDHGPLRASLLKMSTPTTQYHTKTPPINGAFPLDHEGECRPLVEKYLRCLKANRAVLTPCRELAKRYFECRMQSGLMASDDWNNLGFGDLSHEGLDEKNKINETG